MSEHTLDRTQIHKYKHADEKSCVDALLEQSILSRAERSALINTTRELVNQCRDNRHEGDWLDAFLQEFDLSNKEGIALMCLAESLLRIPDKETADKMISEKIANADWAAHRGHSDTLFVNASVWGLMLTGRIVKLDFDHDAHSSNWLAALIKKTGEPLIRRAILQAMRIMGGQYILGQTIEAGIKRAQHSGTLKSRYSFDMLGEGARTEADAERHYQSYLHAIETMGQASIKRTDGSANVYQNDGISIKLSALTPRFEYAQHQTMMPILFMKVKSLALLARNYDLGFSIDAEEADRLDLSLELFQNLATDADLKNWDGLGFVLQAYQKRAVLVVDWLINLAQCTQRKLMVRLVKGAYWDSEIKHTQEQGFDDYPVFTRKPNTDLSYQICAQKLLAHKSCIFAQFATHNATTVALIMCLAARYKCQSSDFEFQRLHGMGELLYSQLKISHPTFTFNIRVYAPIGKHRDLLPYLVRRLLENGANSSFVNRFLDAELPVDELVQDPLDLVKHSASRRHPQIALPLDQFKLADESRQQARGLDLNCPLTVPPLLSYIHQTAGKLPKASHQSDQALTALASACSAQKSWATQSTEHRAQLLECVGDALQKNRDRLISLIVNEAHRTLDDAVSEVREAIDFCYYYAALARNKLGHSQALIGPTGESNHLSFHGRGTFLCISPWNFPLAIFVGQIAAALVAGNAVLAKSATQTSGIAQYAIELFHQAGIPKQLLHLLLGRGSEITPVLLTDKRLSGCAFTGSTETAQAINQLMATRKDAIIPLIAETGGVNAMIADSTALPEQLVDDIISSAFKSAGQRCSALRVLFLQSDNADDVITMLKGAMQALVIGEPTELTTDIGPVIDHQAASALNDYIKEMKQRTILIAECALTENQKNQHFVAPTVFEINHLNELEGEVFGPILHIIRYEASAIDSVIDAINHTGYALTLGIHSRISGFADAIFNKTLIGNTYINRNITGAVVGVNPFGGCGLSGTGPKAGGPNYLYRFVSEKTRTENLNAKGGNIDLFSLSDTES